MDLQKTSKIQIPDVTLIAVDCTNRIRGTINALKICTEKIDFGNVVLLRHKNPDNIPSFIVYKKIKRIKNIDEYNSFMFLELYKYFDTSHCLTVQDHAYIINPEMWDSYWLNYDYLGCTWDIVPNTYIANNGKRVRVGNGGFSLRSKRMCEIPSKMGWRLREERGFKNEDGQINCYYRKEFLELGIRYGGLEDSVKFGYEKPMKENNWGYQKFFGFHRNIPRNKERVNI